MFSQNSGRHKHITYHQRNNRVGCSPRFEDGTDINSPDSNDSGIQSDTRSDDGVSHVRGPVNDDIYAVVNKKGKASGDSPDTPDSVYEVSVCVSGGQCL